MKKGTAITVISILAAAAIALGALFGVTYSQKNQAISERDGFKEENIRLSADIADRDGQISSLTGAAEEKAGEVETLTADLAAKTEDLAARTEEIGKLTEDAAAKAGEIEKLTADLTAKAGEIETLTADLTAKAGEIETLTADLTAKAEEIEALKTAAAEKDEKIDALTADAAEKAAKIEQNRKKLEEQEAAIKIQEEAAAEKDRKIGELEASAAGLQSKVDALTAEVEEKDETIRNLNAELEGRAHTAEKKSGEEPAPAEELPDNPGLKFGMSREEVKEVLGAWDEEDEFHAGYSIIRYQNRPFRGYVSTFAIIFKDGKLHMWLYGVQDGKPFGELEPEMTGRYGASSENKASVIEVFAALDVTLTEEILNSMIADGSVDYRFWHANGETDCILMKVDTGSRQMTVLAIMQPVE